MQKSTLCSLLTVTVLGCSPAYQSPREWQPRSAMDNHVQELLSRPVQSSSISFPPLSRGRNYIVLIDKYDDVKQLSQLAGFSGHYGHIEVVRDGEVYGCRPSQCKAMSLKELQQMFRGYAYEVRDVEINGDASRAVNWFNDNLQGRSYDLFYNNCTDAVVGMYDASGDKTVRVPPILVDQTYATNVRLRNFMQANGIPKPNRPVIWFPDQFESLGELVAKGVF